MKKDGLFRLREKVCLPLSYLFPSWSRFFGEGGGRQKLPGTVLTCRSERLFVVRKKKKTGRGISKRRREQASGVPAFLIVKAPSSKKWNGATVPYRAG